jgi:hypothetical protein
MASLYVSAMTGNIKRFEEARKLFAERVEARKDKHVRFVGDGTGFLFKNRHLDECVKLEEWWQEKPFEGSHICPFEKQRDGSFPHEMHLKRVIANTHDVVINESSELTEQMKANTLNTLQAVTIIIERC